MMNATTQARDAVYIGAIVGALAFVVCVAMLAVVGRRCTMRKSSSSTQEPARLIPMQGLFVRTTERCLVL